MAITIQDGGANQWRVNCTNCDYMVLILVSDTRTSRDLLWRVRGLEQRHRRDGHIYRGGRAVNQ